MSAFGRHIFSPRIKCKLCWKHRLYRCLSSQTYGRNPWKDQDIEKTVDISVGNGTLTLNTGQYARFADGSVMGKYGNTSVLVTAVSQGKSSNNFLPLTVDYRQKAAAAGRIPTNHLRRELGPSDREILTSRMIDRSIRPLFPPGYYIDTQVVCNLLAVDGQNDADLVSINAASAALALSDIPWAGPVGAVRVGIVENEIVINPTRREMAHSTLDLVVSGTDNNKVVMLEASADCVSQPDFRHAIKEGVKETQKIIRAIREMAQTHGKPKRPLPEPPQVSPEVRDAIKSLAEMKIKDIFSDSIHHKVSRDQAVNMVREKTISYLQDAYPDENPALFHEAFSELARNTFRDLIFECDMRCDGRKLDEIRPISCGVNLFSPLHGSAMFQRGQTQVLCTVTFDSPDAAAKLDPITALIGGMKEKNFFVHYEFPPYATNETGRAGVMGRRELGHGALAEKGLKAVVPNDFPFTIRLTSEVLESNGSSSMATVCGGSLAMMDAGVPISEPAAGVAVGLVSRCDEGGSITDYRVLTDLLGIEDYMGDMDFKYAGTSKGVTALQADIKVAGLPLKVIMEAEQRAWEGKTRILKVMKDAIPTQRQGKKDNSPIIQDLQVLANKRSRFVGLGGYNIRKLMADTGVSVIPEDETTFKLFAPNQTAMDEAMERIDELLKDEKEPQLEFGGIYKAKIVEIKDFGVMVTLYPGMTPALIHNSQLDQRKISHPSVLSIEVGQEITVKYFGWDPASGRMRLSRKLLQGPASAIIRNLGGKTSADS